MPRFSAKVDEIKGYNTSLQKKIHHLVGRCGVLKAESEANARSARSCKIQYSDILVECDKLKKEVEELHAQPPTRVVTDEGGECDCNCECDRRGIGVAC